MRRAAARYLFMVAGTPKLALLAAGVLVAGYEARWAAEAGAAAPTLLGACEAGAAAELCGDYGLVRMMAVLATVLVALALAQVFVLSRERLWRERQHEQLGRRLHACRRVRWDRTCRRRRAACGGGEGLADRHRPSFDAGRLL